MAPSISDLIRETTGISLASYSDATASKKVPMPRIATLHPLDNLSADEITAACDIVKANRSGKPLWIKVATLREPNKADLVPFLEAERKGSPIDSLRPARQADVIFFDLSTQELVEAIIDLDQSKEVKSLIIDGHHAPLDRAEIRAALAGLLDSPEYQATVDRFGIAKELVVPQAWPYGSDNADTAPRRMFFILYHRDPATNHPDSNHYAFPIPAVIFWDVWEKKVIEVQDCYTGDEADGLTLGTNKATNPTAHCVFNEILPELRPTPVRTDLKPLHVSQPEGVSFKVTGQLIEWQKWRFRVGFNYREGPTLHDVTFDGRSISYRMSLSEMHVPYADPRAPLHLRQVFDFGDIGLGRAANSLENGCDCLGSMKYFDGAEVSNDGVGRIVKNVICCHEQDNGILWKHTNTPTGRAAITRQRLLILQTIITVGNYDYIFAWHFDQAGGIHLESRATGILSTGPIDPGKKSPYGTVVAPGVLGTSHQHFINLRIDPAIDGHNNLIVQDEVVADPPSEVNAHNIAFRIKSTPITTSGWADANPLANRSFKILNPSVINPISMTPTGYKLVPHPSQMRLASPDSHIAKRAPFTEHHIWVTKYRDGELFPAGFYTNQSRDNAGGLKQWVERNDSVENTDIVLWHTFALTHVPRVEDFPVMPVETHTISLKPVNFFNENPAMDVPQSTQSFNKSQLAEQCCHGAGDAAATPVVEGHGIGNVAV